MKKFNNADKQRLDKLANRILKANVPKLFESDPEYKFPKTPRRKKRVSVKSNSVVANTNATWDTFSLEKARKFMESSEFDRFFKAELQADIDLRAKEVVSEMREREFEVLLAKLNDVERRLRIAYVGFNEVYGQETNIRTLNEDLKNIDALVLDVKGIPVNFSDPEKLDWYIAKMRDFLREYGQRTMSWEMRLSSLWEEKLWEEKAQPVKNLQPVWEGNMNDFVETLQPTEEENIPPVRRGNREVLQRREFDAVREQILAFRKRLQAIYSAFSSENSEIKWKMEVNVLLGDLQTLILEINWLEPFSETSPQKMAYVSSRMREFLNKNQSKSGVWERELLEIQKKKAEEREKEQLRQYEMGIPRDNEGYYTLSNGEVITLEEAKRRGIRKVPSYQPKSGYGSINWKTDETVPENKIIALPSAYSSLDEAIEKSGVKGKIPESVRREVEKILKSDEDQEKFYNQILPFDRNGRPLDSTLNSQLQQARDEIARLRAELSNCWDTIEALRRKAEQVQYEYVEVSSGDIRLLPVGNKSLSKRGGGNSSSSLVTKVSNGNGSKPKKRGREIIL